MSDLAYPAMPAAPARPWTKLYVSGRGEMYTGLTTESLEAYRAAHATWQAALKVWQAECEQVAKVAAALLIEQGFPTQRETVSTTGRYRKKRVESLCNLLRSFGPGPPYDPGFFLSDETRWLEGAKQRERAERIKAEDIALRDRAVVWLQARGKVYGVDFTADDAPRVALTLAAEAIIASRKGQWNRFGADDDCRGCSGWDGESRRCECGNRRVSWKIGGTFEEPSVYGEAY